MSNRRSLKFEPLESRVVLTCAPDFATSIGFEHCWQNEEVPADVNADGEVTPLDALIVINELEDRVWSSKETAELPDNPYFNFPFDVFSTRPPLFDFDVDGDGSVSPIDALLTVNSIENTTLLDANGQSKGLSGDARVEWNENNGRLFDESLSIRAGSADSLQSIEVTFRTTITPEGVYASQSYGIDLSVDTFGTFITATLEDGSLRLDGEDSLENYRKVLSSVNFEVESVPERSGSRSAILIEIDDGKMTTRTHVNLDVRDYSEQLIGQSLGEAQQWAEQRFDLIRTIAPNSSITADYRPNRFNISYNDASVVTRVSFG